MNYSLNLILEKSGISPQQYRIVNPAENYRYDSIQLYPGNPAFCQPHTIYACTVFPQAPPDSDGSNKYAGQKLLPPDCCVLLFKHEANESELSGQFPKNLPVLILYGTNPEEGFRQISTSIQLLKEQSEQLTDAVYQNTKLKDLLLMICDFLENPGYIVDSSFKVLAIDTRNNMRELTATWRHLEDDGYLPYNLVSALMENQELYHMEHFHEAHLVHSKHFYVPFINYNLRKKRKLTGHLFIAAIYRAITPGDIELLTAYGRLVEIALNSSIPYQQERGYQYEYFISDLLRGHVSDPKYIQTQMHSLKFSEKVPMIIAACSISGQNELALERLRSQLERFRSGRSILLNSHVISLMQLKPEDTEDSLKEELNSMAERFDFFAGVSEILSDFLHIHACYQQAERALTMLQSVPVPGRKTSLKLPASCRGKKVILYRDCALTQLLESFLQQPESDFYFQDCVQTLLKYDAQKGTDFAHTLLVYLEKERNIVQTAAELHMHRNSLRYRIQKIFSLTGADLDNPQTRVRLYLSLLRHQQA